MLNKSLNKQKHHPRLQNMNRERDKVDTNLILPKTFPRRVSQPSKRAQGLDYTTTGLAPKKGKRE